MPTTVLTDLANRPIAQVSDDGRSVQVAQAGQFADVLSIARATFDASIAANQTQAAHGLGIIIPDKAIIVGGFMQVLVAVTGVGASLAISVQSANDIQTAAAINGAPWSTTGLKAIVPKANTPESTGIAVSGGSKEITATPSAANLTAGKVLIVLYYVMGA